MAETGYVDLEIRILKLEDQGYPVEITLSSEQEFPRGYLRGDFLPWVPGASPTEDGRRLFDELLADDRVKVAWAEARGQYPQRRIRLRIDAEAPELHAIPWELLRDGGDDTPAQDLAAATATPFSRYLAGRWQPGRPILMRPVRILAAMANPAGLERYGLTALDVEAEWRSLQAATAGLEVELVALPQPCTLPALEAELRNGYHILHFVGHGAYNAADQQAALFFAGADGQVVLVRDDELAEMLARQYGDAAAKKGDRLRLVFLASCQTATRSPANAFRGLAPRLVAAGVPAVVAMQELVAVDTAQAFTVTFYRQLLQHGQVDLAGNEARSALLTGKLPGAAIPVLFLRLRSGRLLGRRGHVTGLQGRELFWDRLLLEIADGRCTPFLGPRVNDGLLPGPGQVAEKLADLYHYPLPDRRRLAGVAQFMAIQNPDRLRTDYLRLLRSSLFPYLDRKPTEEDRQRLKKASFAETAEYLHWAEQVLVVQEDEIHHALANLDLPLYVTTNPDSFMFEALKYQRLTPRRIGPRWQPQVGIPQYTLPGFPDPQSPVVLHLNGYDAGTLDAGNGSHRGEDNQQRQHLVLSEDDYLAHFVRLSRDQRTTLPMNLLEALAQHTFLFLGYSVDDWDFRVIVQGLLASIAQTRGKRRHVGVQLEVDRQPDADRIAEYLQLYLGQFNIDIYWGTPRQFSTELHTRWQEYLEAKGDDWGL